MKSNRTTNGSARRGFISTQAAIVLAVVTGSAGLLAYEWHHAHPPKTHHSSAGGNHHHKKATATN